MSRWFRHYAGMMRDDKLVSAAVKSRQSVERVVWVWGAILESALEVDDAGRFELAPDEAAYFLRCDEGDIVGILAALETAGRICAGVVVKWSDRQFQSDQSKDRQKRYRDRLKSHGDGGSDVTQTSRDGEVTPQETDTDSETDSSVDRTSLLVGSLSKPKAEPRPKGTRLSSEWVLPKAMGDWALERGLPRERILLEAEKMRDWSINAGKLGVKVDWFAAWRNWVKKAIDELPKARGSPPPGRPNQALVAARQLMEKLNAVPPSETQTDRTYPRLVAPGVG